MENDIVKYFTNITIYYRWHEAFINQKKNQQYIQRH